MLAKYNLFVGTLSVSNYHLIKPFNVPSCKCPNLLIGVDKPILYFHFLSLIGFGESIFTSNNTGALKRSIYFGSPF